MPLGQDVGRDIRPQADVPTGLVCDAGKEGINNPVSGGYDSTYPMARLALGQEITQTWPAKNHADVGTQRGVQLFISKTAGGGDDFSHITSKAAWLAKYPKLTYTFSECNPPGPNNDRAECKGKYTVPTDLTPGIYTFMWWWEFNGGEFYNTCYDVEVLAASGNPSPNPTPAPNPNPTPGPTPAPNPTPAPLCPAPNPSPTGGSPATPAGTCACAKSTPWDGSFGQYVTGKDFCSQGFGNNNPYICFGGGDGNAQACAASTCQPGGQMSFSQNEGWKISVAQGGSPYRACAFVSFCNGRPIGECWTTPEIKFSFSFKTSGLAAMTAYVKLFFWTDNGNMLGLLPPSHSKAGGQYKLITFPQDDFPNYWKSEMVIQDNSWYHMEVTFHPETKGVTLMLNGAMLDESTIPAANMLTDSNGPQLGAYVFGSQANFDLWIHDTCIGAHSGTCPSMGTGGRRLLDHLGRELVPCPAPAPKLEGQYSALPGRQAFVGIAAAASTTFSLTSAFVILFLLVQSFQC
jgi:hypothetical protein